MNFDYKMPILLSCGHTFEKNDIKTKQKCPKCKEPCYIIAPNWTLIDYLRLNLKYDVLDHDDIKQKAIENVKKYQQSRYIQDVHTTEYYIPKIIKRIKHRSSLGYHFTIYRPHLFYSISDHVYQLIEMELKKHGFYVGRWYNFGMLNIYISWYNFHS
jgi:hypothetical protein